MLIPKEMRWVKVLSRHHLFLCFLGIPKSLPLVKENFNCTIISNNAREVLCAIGCVIILNHACITCGSEFIITYVCYICRYVSSKTPF